MSETSISTQSASPDREFIPSAEVDASCRPLTLLFLSSMGWLILATVLGFISALKFHSPAILADCPFATYGRIHPAYLNCLIYGFGIQAGLAVTLWVVAQLGRTTLKFAPAAIAGWVVWNTGITLGVGGILYGDSTGFEWLEMPRYGVGMAFFGYILIAISALVTFHSRRERNLSISHWFMVTALFWFPWVYSTATYLLLSNNPVRGVLQASVDYWYINNLTNIVLGFIGLGTIFYFVPKLSRQPLNSYYNALFVFVCLALFGSWGGVPAGTPLPSWISALSTMGSLTTLAPAFAVLMIIILTVRGSDVSCEERRLLRYALFASLAYAVSVSATALTSLRWVSKVTHFTWFLPANAQLFVFGFLAMALFGAAYHILPKILGQPFCKPGLIAVHFWLAALGIIIHVLPLMLGGIHQGRALNDASQPFFNIMRDSLGPLRASTTGDLLMAIGNVIFAINVTGLVLKTLKISAQQTVIELTTPVEVTP